MPRKPIDYSKTVIYKIVCIDSDVNYLYIGSTTDFTRRKQCHKSNCNNSKNKSYNQKKYQEIRNNGGWRNFKMLEIKKFPCNDRREAESEENKVMLELEANMNTNRSSRTQKQYYEDNKEQFKEYYAANKEYKKNYNSQYYEDNKDKIKDYKKQYYEKNSEKINQKYECECGGKYTTKRKSQHFSTQKHIKYLEISNLEISDSQNNNNNSPFSITLKI